MVGPDYPVDAFLEVRIPLNLESEERRLPRYTAWIEKPPTAPGGAHAGINGANGSHPHHHHHGKPHSRASSSKNVSPRDVTSPRSTNSGSGTTAATSVAAGAGAATPGIRQRAGERGREGTVRFILNPDREREEKAIIQSYRGE